MTLPPSAIIRGLAQSDTRTFREGRKQLRLILELLGT